MVLANGRFVEQGIGQLSAVVSHSVFPEYPFEGGGEAAPGAEDVLALDVGDDGRGVEERVCAHDGLRAARYHEAVAVVVH